MDEFKIIVEDEKTDDASTAIMNDFLKGEKGEKGDTNKLTIGIVEKGEEASASIVGESPNQILNLVLPKGDKGDTGEAFTYDKFTTEQLENLRGPQGKQGIQGEQGLTGDKGDKGDDGSPGYTPIKGIDYFTDNEIAEIKNNLQEEVNTQINEVNEQLTNIEQEGIIVSPTEPTENRRKVWMQNVDGDKKIHVLNDNDVYEEFMKKEENVDSSKILHHGETLNNLLNKGTFKEYNGNLSGNTTYDINLSLGQFSIVIVTLIQGFNAEIVGAFTANYTGYFFTQFLKQTIASTFLDKIERRDYFLRLTVKNTSNIQYKIKVLTL